MRADTRDPKECFKVRSRPLEAPFDIVLLIRLSVHTKQIEYLKLVNIIQFWLKWAITDTLHEALHELL